MKHIIKHRVRVTFAIMHVFAPRCYGKDRVLAKGKEWWWYDTPNVRQAIRGATLGYLKRSKAKIRICDHVRVVLHLDVERRVKGVMVRTPWVTEVILGEPRIGWVCSVPQIVKQVKQKG